MRRFAAWFGALLLGTLPGRYVHSILVRAVAMLIAACFLSFLALDLLVADESPSGQGRLWQGLVVLAIALVVRAVYELWELDGWLAGATVFGAMFAGMAAGAWSNLPGDPSLLERMWGFVAVAVVAGIIAGWRVGVAVRDHERHSEQGPG
jgi:hypothetical protein